MLYYEQIKDRRAAMRKEFIQCADRRTAWRHCPWASKIVKAEGGYWAFETLTDYQTWRGQR